MEVRDSDGVVEVTSLDPSGDARDKTRPFLLAEDIEPTPVVEGRLDNDAPYSLYQIGSFDGNKSHLLRISMTFEGDTYTKLIGETNSFSIYGENRLFQKIRMEEFPNPQVSNL